MYRPLSHPTALLAAVILSVAPGLNAAERVLTRLWETPPVMAKPESAVYDPQRDVIYVSNINGEYLARDGNGFISTIRTDGTVVDAHWVDAGLDNPQGLALDGDTLYVADIDRMCRIDIDTGRIDGQFPVEGAKFFNDLSVGADGDLFVSDCFDNKLYRVHDGEIALWLDAPELQGPNGLLALSDAVMVLLFSEGKCYRVDRESKELTLFCEGIENADGIAGDGADGFFISGAWQGQVYHIDPQGQKALVLDLGETKTIAADICYIPEKRLLIVPTLDKTVLGYRWE